MTNKLYKHQIEFLNQNPDKSALVWSCGTGKTRTALEWAKSSHRSSLIIVPKALKANWHREIKKIWNNEDCCMVDVVTKEEFRRDWDGQYLSEDYGNIIVDEVHNGFLTPHFKSQMSKALKKYIRKHKVQRVLLLSATVYTSSPWNIYNLAVLTGHNWNWQKFNNTFFDQVRMGFRMIPIPKKGCEAKLAQLTKKIASVVDIHDCMDVPEQLHCDPEYFALTKEQQQAIKDNYDPLPIVRYTAQHEIENGVLLANEFRATQRFVTDKNDRILELAGENPKMAIVCRYNAQIDYLADALDGYNVYIIRGDVKDRDSVCINAEKAKKAIVLIQADCGVGFQLPSFELCVFMSMSYSYTAKKQMEGRFLRIDRPSRTTFMYLLTEGDSIDQAVYDAIARKEDFSIELYNKKN